MKLKLTPFNIVSAFGIVSAVLLLLNNPWFVAPANFAHRGPMVAFCVLMVFVAFLADQVFRKFIPSIFKIWVLELALITLTIVLLMILKVSFVN